MKTARGMTFYPLFVLNWLVLIQLVCGQSRVSDSLQRVLPTLKEDTGKVNTLNQLSQNFGPMLDLANSIEYARQALSLAQKIRFKKGEGIAYLNLGWAFSSKRNIPEAMKNCKLALAIFKKLNDKQHMAKCYARIGMVYSRNGNHSQALTYLNTALKQYQALSDKKQIAQCYKMIAVIYGSQNDQPNTLKNYYSALKLFEQINDKEEVAHVNNAIGYIYRNYLGNVKEALHFFTAALKSHKELGNKLEMARTSFGIVGIYFMQGEYDEALKRSYVMLRLFQEAGSPAWGLAMTYSVVGDIYQKMGDKAAAGGDKDTAEKHFTETLKHYTLAYEYRKNFAPPFVIAADNIAIGEIYIKLKNYNKARNYLQKGLQMSRTAPAGNKEPLSLASLSGAHRGLAQIDSIRGNYQHAFLHYQEHIAYRDSLKKEEDTKQLVQTKMQYEFDKKEAAAKAEEEKREAERQRIRNRLYLILTSLGMLLMGALALAYLQWRYKKQKQIANTLLQQKNGEIANTLHQLKATQEQLLQKEKLVALQAQMNPHFVFNCLNSIQFFTLQNDSEQASNYLTKFARQIRLVLENSRSESVTLSNELEALQLYIGLESLRFDERLHYQITVVNRIGKFLVKAQRLHLQIKLKGL